MAITTPHESKKMFGEILTLALCFFICKYDYKPADNNKSLYVFEHHKGRKVHYRFKLNDRALSLLHDICPSSKIILWGTKLRTVIFGTGERFLIRVPRVQITQETLCEDGTIKKTRTTKVVLPDFLLPGKLYGTKTLLLFMFPLGEPGASREHEDLISRFASAQAYDRLVRYLLTPKGKERAAYIRRHRQKFLDDLSLQNSLKTSRQITCPEDYRLIPSFARKKKAADAYFIEPSSTGAEGRIVTVAVTARGLARAPGKLDPHALTWPAILAPHNGLTAANDGCGSCHLLLDSS